MTREHKLTALLSSDDDIAAAAAIIERLNLTVGASFDDVVARVIELYGKPLHLEPVDDGRLASLTGLWMEMEDVGYVFFRASDSITYKTHSIFHEFGHILGDHANCDVMNIVTRASLGKHGLGAQMQNGGETGLLEDPAERVAELVAYGLSNLVLQQDTVDLRAALE